MHDAGFVWDTVTRMVRRESREADSDMIKAICNQAYAEISGLTSWEMMRSKVDLELGSDGYAWVPSNFLGVDAVRFADGDALEYQEILGYNESAISKDEHLYRYSFFDYVKSKSECLATGTFEVGINDSTINAASADFTGTSNSDWAGEFIRLDREPFYYEIASAQAGNGAAELALVSSYRGPKYEDAPFQIRPPGSKKIKVVDHNEDVVTSRTVTLHGWVMPEGLYDADDIMLLPSSEPLWLMTVVKTLEIIGRKERAASGFRTRLYGQAGRESDGAMHMMIASNPEYSRPSYPRDVHNKLFANTDSMYMRSGSMSNTLLERFRSN